MTIQLRPSYAFARVGLSGVYHANGMREQADRCLRDAEADAGTYAICLGHIVFGYGLFGRSDDAQRVFDRLAELKNERYVSAHASALAHFGVGRKDEAFELWERALELRDAHLVYLKYSPIYDSVRADPRFQDLVRRIGFPEG
jgi:tetratricopeptide (TPR) repeat protein